MGFTWKFHVKAEHGLIMELLFGWGLHGISMLTRNVEFPCKAVFEPPLNMEYPC